MIHNALRRLRLPQTFTVLISIFAVIAGTVAGFIYWSTFSLPALKALEEYEPAESSFVYSADGGLVAEFYIERRNFIPHYEIPEHVKAAFVAIEDVRFYKHPGIDLKGIIRAFFHDIRTMSASQGGSTITQQLAKMLFLKPERSLKRKIKEAILSIQIERQYTKDEILGLYLNQAYFGTRSYGIEAASQTHFGKPAKDLTTGEAALLASLPKAPSLYSPFKYPEKAKDRRDTVLGLMFNNKFITHSEYNNALKEPLPERPFFRKYDAPYFTEMLRQSLEAGYNNDLYTSGLRIYTTLDLEMQKYAEEAVSDGITAIEQRAEKGVQAALVAMDIRTGGIRAMVGGSDFWKNQFNRATQALRQSGSAFKPFVYLAAIESGMKADNLILDAQMSFRGSQRGQTWSPKNYDGKYYGPVTLRKAFAKSLNAATVRLADKVGISTVIDTAKRIGIKSRLQPFLPIALGSADLTLLELVSAYRALASGVYSEPLLYDRVIKRDSVIEEINLKPIEVLSKEEMTEMKKLLRAVIDEGTATQARVLNRVIYGKTGTTNDYTNAWFIGFDNRLVTGVWVGRDNNKPIGDKESGASAALPIWVEFMKKVLQQTQPAQSPSDPQSPPQRQ